MTSLIVQILRTKDTELSKLAVGFNKSRNFADYLNARCI